MMIPDLLDSPWKGHESGPIVYNISQSHDSDGWLTCEPDDIMKEYAQKQKWRRRRQQCISLLLIMFFLSLTLSLVMLLVSPKDSPQKSWTSHCTLEACNLTVVTIMKGGKAHPCKAFCEKHLEWNPYLEKDQQTVSTPPKLYGSFDKHGVCPRQQQLTLTDGIDSLVSRQSSHLPDFTSLFSNQLDQKSIFIIGDSITRQVFEVLPMVLPEGYQTFTQNYEYNEDTISRIHSCNIDFEQQQMFCKHSDGEKYACDCSTIDTIRAGNVTVDFAWAYGISFPKGDGTLESYGLGYNIIQPPLYEKLARSADAIIINMGVMSHHLERDVPGFTDFLHFVVDWSKSIKSQLIYRLTLPQHFKTKADPPSTYLDEERDGGECVDVAPSRHWTDTLAQKVLHGKVDIIDQFSILATQGKFHSIKSGDCADWCLGYDSFYTFWASIAEAVM